MLSMLLSILILSPSFAEDFTGSYTFHQPGITYQIQLNEAEDGTIRGVLSSTVVTLPIYGHRDGNSASGDLLGLGNLGFQARLEEGELRFDILVVDATGNRNSKSGQSLHLHRLEDATLVAELNRKAIQAEKAIEAYESRHQKEMVGPPEKYRHYESPQKK